MDAEAEYFHEDSKHPIADLEEYRSILEKKKQDTGQTRWQWFQEKASNVKASISNRLKKGDDAEDEKEEEVQQEGRKGQEYWSQHFYDISASCADNHPDTGDVVLLGFGNGALLAIGGAVGGKFIGNDDPETPKSSEASQ